MVHFFIGAKTQQHFLMTSLFFCLWNVYGTYPILQYLLKYHTLLNTLPTIILHVQKSDCR